MTLNTLWLLPPPVWLVIGGMFGFLLALAICTRRKDAFSSLGYCEGCAAARDQAHLSECSVVVMKKL